MLYIVSFVELLSENHGQYCLQETDDLLQKLKETAESNYV
jgi:hypothetical protein